MSHTIGAITVSPKDGTTITATQSGQTVTLQAASQATFSDQYAAFVPYDPSLTGNWQFEATNGSDVTTFQGPAHASVPQVEFATNIVMTPNGLTPTFTWDDPGNADWISISIFDLERRNNLGLADRIEIERVTGGSYTIPAGLLEDGRRYSFNVAGNIGYTAADDPGTNPDGSSRVGDTRSRSRVFVDFVAGGLTAGDPVYLPVVDNSGPIPFFDFNNPVLAGLVEYYDPVFAVGYDFAIGDGNPNFSSVVLPDIGDGVYSLYLNDGSGFSFFDTILAGEEYAFGGNGVSEFRILGIETGAGLQPDDPTAFVTGLSFFSDGQFTGRMTPILQDVSEVPLPATGFLLFGGVAGLIIMRRRKNPSATAN
ncbi:MAG: VPLPA-CTERM sorting domain-containing protein [Paracoccaceae bacterium]|nr:VPLPA-CTERM sorting domain-containing protein [Paracoccaceae bacterium]